jgi:hypothetical protein
VIQVELFGGTGALPPLVEQQVVAAVGGVELKPSVSGALPSSAGLARDARSALRKPVAAEVGKPLE